MFARLVAVLLLVVACAAHAHAQSDDQLVITTRSTGTMTADPNAQEMLGLPEGTFDYELVVTTQVFRNFLVNDPMWLRSEGYADLSLIVNGVRWTDRETDPYYSYTDAKFGSDVLFGGTDETFTHDIILGLGIGPVLKGYQQVRWPVGSFPGTIGFGDQEWTFDGPGVGDVRMNLTIGGDIYGSIEGSANYFQMSIAAVPEPAQVALLAAGLGVFALYRRRRPVGRSWSHNRTPGVLH